MALVTAKPISVCITSSSSCRHSLTTAASRRTTPTLRVSNGKLSLRSKLTVDRRLKAIVCKPLSGAQPKRVVLVQATTSEAGSKEIIEDSEFSISKVSFGSIGLTVGLSFLTFGFGAFFQLWPGQSISALLLIYGFPISLIGFALQYAKLDPVPLTSYADAFALRESQATPIQNQVRNDVTRYRYGDEQHLDEALKRVFRIGAAGGLPRRLTPKLTGLREEVIDGLYTLVLIFGDQCDVEEFTSRQPKLQSFFGPGVYAVVNAVEGGTEVALVSDGTNAGGSEADEWEVLPPLTPSSPPRRVKKGSVK